MCPADEKTLITQDSDALIQSIDEPKPSTEEEHLLGDFSPLRTTINLSVGPLLSQMGQAVYGLVDSIWVAKALGSEGISVLGAVFIVEFVASAVASFLSVAIAARTSYLLGQKHADEITQMYVDFFRLCIIFGIAIPCIIIPIVKPLVVWFGADARIAMLSQQYMWPGTAGCVFNLLYNVACGLIQAQGRSALFGVVQTASLVANMAIFDPALLFGFHTGVWGISLSAILSQGIPGIILTILVWSGKFVVCPKFSMLFKKFSSHTGPALAVGFSSLIASISLTIPQILMQKYVNNAAICIDKYMIFTQIWTVIEKLYQITGGISVAFGQAVLPAASFAFGANRLNRLLRISLHGLWISTIACVFFGYLIVIFARPICSIWSTDNEFLHYACQCIPIVFYTALLTAFQYIVPSMLQSMKMITSSTVLSILTLLVPLPLFSTVLYFTKKDDPVRIIWAYPLNDIYSLVVSAFFLIRPIKLLKKAEASDKQGMTHSHSMYM